MPDIMLKFHPWIMAAFALCTDKRRRAGMAGRVRLNCAKNRRPTAARAAGQRLENSLEHFHHYGTV